MTLVHPRPALRRIIVFCRAALVAGAAAASGCSRRTTAATAATAAVAPAADQAAIRDLDIAFYSARVKRDPTGAFDLARLASLYLQRSRETGDPRDAIRAQEAARRSLHNRRAHNDQAAQILSSALLSQHRFAEALVVAKDLRDRNPESAPLAASAAEIEMELGQYDSARVAFAALSDATTDLAVAPRLARWAEIRGHPDEARGFMRSALVVAQHASSLPHEQLAWFWLRSGDIELRTGHLAAADSAYRAGLAVHAGDYRILAALCRLSSIEQRWKDALSYGQQAIAQNLDPATLGLLSDAAEAVGDSAQATEFARVLDVAVLNQPGAYHRAWSLFLLDHDRHIDTVYGKVLEELKTRRDIYGYDLLAWSLHKKHRDVEAREAMEKALSQGTRDALLFYHASVIERSLGHVAMATGYLARAAAVDPSYKTSESAEHAQ